MRATSLALLLLPACAEFEPKGQDNVRGNKPPGEDFATDTTVRVVSPSNGDTVGSSFVLAWEAGDAIDYMRLEVNGAPYSAALLEGSTGEMVLELPNGRFNLSVVGFDEHGASVAHHDLAIRVVAEAEDPWVTLTSPADGALVSNPVTFTSAASEGVDELRYIVDEWPIGTTEPDRVLRYEFSGTGYEREVRVEAYDDGELVATDQITIVVEDGAVALPSDFNTLVLRYLSEYPTDGSFAYYWPDDTDWGGNPNDIYYQGRLFSAGDPYQRSFCLGITFEVFMRSFEELDRVSGGDGSINGVPFDELYELRTDWFVRELYGAGVVDALINYGIGEEVTDFDDVRPGDMIQFWRHSGSGHNAIFIDWLVDESGEIEGFTYWSTQGSTDGIDYNEELFGSRGSSVDPNLFFAGRVWMPEDWLPWR